MQVQELIAAARQQTGLTDLGDERIMEALNHLVDALNAEAKLNARGEQAVQANLVATLANRMRVEDYLTRHPALLERPIEKPLFVFGLPRTGTTLVINLLSVDPSRRCFLRWESLDSVPPPTPQELHAGPRYEQCQAQTQLALKHAAHIAAIHYEDADSPTECQFAMTPSFVSQYYDSMYDIPSYHRWFLHESGLPARLRIPQAPAADAAGESRRSLDPEKPLAPPVPRRTHHGVSRRATGDDASRSCGRGRIRLQPDQGNTPDVQR